MLPFSVHLQRGQPAQDQILAAVQEAFASGQLRDGDSFPSARELSQELKVSPSTAQGVVDQLVADGFLAQLRGSGLLVRTAPPAGWVREMKARQEDVLVTAVGSPASPGEVGSGFPFLAPSPAEGVEGILDHYEVIRLIARGGMGIVFEARDPHLQRRVAIKVLAPHLAVSKESRTRFLREARAIAAVDHEHVLPVHAVGEHRGFPYLVMPLVDGESLRQRLEREGALPIGEVIRIALAVARGLGAAHREGLIHRDIKPDNVLLEHAGSRIWLVDFGLARAADDNELTRSGVIAGTPQFTSPEQAEGREVDPRSDLFSLGSVLYAMACGRPPFQADNPIAMLRKITDEDPKTPRQLRPDLPDELQDLMMQLLRKAPDERPASAAEVAAQLEQLGT